MKKTTGREQPSPSEVTKTGQKAGKEGTQGKPAVSPADLAGPAATKEPEASATEVISAPDDGSVRVALLLPLSGPNKRIGSALLNAAQLAVFDFADSNFKLLTYDTRGVAEGATDAANLAVGDGVDIILGPLLASSVRAVTPIAREAGVSVISFSTDRTVAGGGVYTLGFLPRGEMGRVVGFARSRGLSRFAALAPDNAYGRRVVQELRRATEIAGGQVVREQFYNPGASDFSAIVRSMANYEVRRANLEDQRRQLETRGDEVAVRTLKRLERLQTSGNLPYEALLVADGGKRLQAVAALLPFYDIDPGKIRMIGTGLWDEPGVGAEPALVGGWYAAPPPTARAAFVRQFEETYGEKPPRLATLSYDATALAAVLAQVPDEDRFSQSTLTNPSGFAGRDGIFRFLPDGTAERGLSVLQINQRDAKIIDPAPETFQALTN